MKNVGDILRGILICCENFKYTEFAETLKNFALENLNIRAETSHLPMRGRCLRALAEDEGTNDLLLVCLTQDLIYKKSEGNTIKEIHNSDMTLKERFKYRCQLTRKYIKIVDKLINIFPNNKNTIGEFSIGACHVNSDENFPSRVSIDMKACEKLGIHPLEIFIHELQHLKRFEDCENPKCIFGNLIITDYGTSCLCKDCEELFENVLKEKFVPNEYKCPDCGNVLKKVEHYDCPNCEGKFSITVDKYK